MGRDVSEGITDEQRAALALLAPALEAETYLARVLELYRQKFPTDDVGHVIRSLAYFGDADAAPLPRGLTPEYWSEIKKDIADRVRGL